MPKHEDKRENRYKSLLEAIFFEHYHRGETEVYFEREDLVRAAEKLHVTLPKNLGDVIYSIRYRTAMPDKIAETQPSDKEWIIEGTGRAHYVFRLVAINRIIPNRELAYIKIPDATPEIVATYSLTDEQALLAKVRYNRLVDVFLGLVSYSLQSHLRTTVKAIGQVEIDEIYVGVDRHGCQYVVPVQAKGGSDQLSTVQVRQDAACCEEKFPRLVCRAVSAQFMEDDLIALFELKCLGSSVRIVDEKHYQLVPADSIDSADLAAYTTRASQ